MEAKQVKVLAAFDKFKNSLDAESIAHAVLSTLDKLYAGKQEALV